MLATRTPGAVWRMHQSRNCRTIFFRPKVEPGTDVETRSVCFGLNVPFRTFLGLHPTVGVPRNTCSLDYFQRRECQVVSAQVLTVRSKTRLQLIFPTPTPH